MAGELVAVEGPKAAGKSMLLSALARRLSTDRIVLTREPTPWFDLRREQELRGAALAEAIAADRAQHVAEVIGPALAAGCTVICDRYVLSSYVFHTGDGVPADHIAELNRGFPRPSLNLVLVVPGAELKRRRAGRRAVTRLQSSDPDAESTAYRRYADLLERDGVPSRFVDNSTMTNHDQLVEWLVTRYAGSR